jgi:hypothetical protein
MDNNNEVSSDDEVTSDEEVTTESFYDEVSTSSDNEVDSFDDEVRSDHLGDETATESVDDDSFDYEDITESFNEVTIECLDTIEQFFESLVANGIIAKQNYTCCNTCGCHDICKDYCLDYEGFVFYHGQEHDSFTERLEDGRFMDAEVRVYLNWDLFEEDGTDDEYLKFVDKIQKIADPFHIRIEGGDATKKLEMYVPLVKNNI